MKLISLSITNMRRIRAAEFDFDGKSLVEVRGRNGAGKSTVIDSILYLLKGSRDIPAGAVTNGEERGVIVANLGEYTVRRVIDPEGKSTLTVENESGKIPKPQDFLDRLSGQFLDPEWFRGLPSAEKRAVILKYSGLDFADIDRRIAEAEQNRLLAGRELKALGTLGPEPEKEEEISVAGLLAQREKIVKYNELQQERARKMRESVKGVRDRMIAALQRDLGTYAELTELLDRMVEEYRAGLEKIQEKLETPEPERPTAEIDESMKNIEETNRKARAHTEWVKKRDDIAAKKAAYDAADKAVADLREEKHGMVAGARLPMPGLGITDTGLTFNGVSDENWSDSEALKIALNVAIAYSGELKAVYIKRGEALDAASLEKLRAYAEKRDFQVIMEVVDDSYAKDGPGVIYIDAGEVVGK